MLHFLTAHLCYKYTVAPFPKGSTQASHQIPDLVHIKIIPLTTTSGLFFDKKSFENLASKNSSYLNNTTVYRFPAPNPGML